MNNFCLALIQINVHPVFMLTKWLRQKDELNAMMFEPVLGISHQAGLEAGQGAWRGCVAAAGNAEQQSSLWAWVNSLAEDIWQACTDTSCMGNVSKL